MEVSVLNIKGQDTGKKVVLNDAVYGITPNDHAIYLDVRLIQANKRQGTAKSKERSEVSGSTRKLGRQKGGGGARRGDINSPVLVGGGRVFGPKPRDYGFKLNKKVKALARRSALSYKAQDSAILVVEDFSFEAPKTKEFIEVLNNLKVADKKTLFVLPGADKCVFLSARNLKKSRITMAQSLNTLEVLDADVMVVLESAVEKIDAILN
ncbi:MAG: 50S ribosomal protein L4 [Bacteroidaceae bacterium]|nr:50S ribosomal protein L4 [Bacteroidaceae bacterium]